MCNASPIFPQLSLWRNRVAEETMQLTKIVSRYLIIDITIRKIAIFANSNKCKNNNILFCKSNAFVLDDIFFHFLELSLVLQFQAFPIFYLLCKRNSKREGNIDNVFYFKL